MGPKGGDAVRLASPWNWGMLPAGTVGIIGGLTDKEIDEHASITFNYSCFRGRSSAHGTGPEYVSCSGGPATIATPVGELKPTGETFTYTAWKWRSTPMRDGGENYQVTAPVWEWNPETTKVN